jgi:hypothetical protein
MLLAEDHDSSVARESPWSRMPSPALPKGGVTAGQICGRARRLSSIASAAAIRIGGVGRLIAGRKALNNFIKSLLAH